MATITSLSEEKFQKCISDCWKLIDTEFKKYCAIIQQGLGHISLVAHKTVLRDTASIKIKDTDLFKFDPDISINLQFCIRREIHSKETSISDILCSLHSSFKIIITQIDKIFNVYNSCNFQKETIAKSSETSLSILEMIDALDTFKRSFCENHTVRKYTIELCQSTNVDKILELWNISEITSLHQDLAVKLSTECS